ncbi:hypothetical protein E2C01_083954 [Portunus trituberculatus]|uniref:Uncharacterized protein n=1 Tax=Portunus trituberculatus TaxID=210409 RepID=A0A5B7J668_PORTR|nr:hypothetical protein [Portunus trituberculatus]
MGDQTLEKRLPVRNPGQGTEESPAQDKQQQPPHVCLRLVVLAG